MLHLTYPQDNPLSVWCRDRDAFLDKLHWQHGRGCNVDTRCEDCQSASGTPLLGPSYQCLDCTLLPMMCVHLLVRNHKALPLHQIEVSEY